MSLQERFDAKWMPEPNSGCHLWTASIDSRGYAHILGDDGRVRLAHRLVWEITRGPIPKGLYVCHKCDVKTCVNPDHLYLGTHQKNIRDAFDRGLFKSRRGERNSAARISGATVLEVRSAGGRYIDIARAFNISPTQVGRIKRREAWSHLTEATHVR